MVAMGLSRLKNLSIQYFLKDNLYTVAHELNSSSDDFVSYKSPHSNWVASQPVAIYRNGIVVPDGEYATNYSDGSVAFTQPQGVDDEILMSYSYNWAEIKGSWPDSLFAKPVISVDIGPSKEGRLELGGSKWVRTLFYLNIFASNPAQRDDMSQLVRELLDRDAPLVDYNKGFPVNRDGTINPLFSQEEQAVGWIEFHDVYVQPNPSGAGDDYEKSRVLIDFEAVTIRRR